MKNSLLAALLVGGSVSFAPALDAAEHADCAQLTQLKLPEVTITEAVAVPASTAGIKLAHCRVTGVIGTEIKFSLLMPDEWNRKFVMGGGGGFVGTVQNQAQIVIGRIMQGETVSDQEVFDALSVQDSLIVGSPETCRRKIKVFQDLGIDRLMCFQQVGQLPHDKVMKSIRMVGDLIPELDRR